MAQLDDWLNQAVNLHRSGQLAEAESLYRQILAADPRHSNAWQLLGAMSLQQQNFPVAVEYLSRAIALGCTHALVYNHLAVAYQSLNQLDQALQAYELALLKQPNFPEALVNRASILKHRGDYSAAISALRRAIELQSDHVDAHAALAASWHELGRADEAIDAYRALLKLRPDDARSHNNLASLLIERHHAVEALAHLDRALALDPRYAKAMNNRGSALKTLGRNVEAEACFRRAVELDPTLVAAYNNIGTSVGSQGRADESHAAIAQAVALDPSNAAIHSNWLMGQLYRSSVNLSTLADMSARWEEQHAAPLRSTWRPFDLDRQSERPLRIAFVSGDFGQHPIGCIMMPIARHAAANNFSCHLYSTRPMRDTLEGVLRQLTDSWHEVGMLSDDRIAEQIRHDQIDVLVDLAGHSAYNHLKVFAYKPAPVQITWAGYQATTGLSAIDYLISDDVMVPYGAEPFYREQLIRLSAAAWCCEVPENAPDLEPRQPRSLNNLTLASFNNPTKLSAEVVAVWSRVLQQLPTARLILKYRGLDEPSMVDHYQRAFARQGVAADRITCSGSTPLLDMLDQYRDVDVALDPFPFGGGVTSLLAMWMGVPVVTWPRDTIASRQTLSMLTRMGTLDGVAYSADEYVAQAVKVAQQALAGGTAARRARREALRGTGFIQGERYVREWAAAVRRAWQAWCQRGM